MLVGFNQSPDHQPGAGDFIHHDGSSQFGYDPDLAAQLLASNSGPQQDPNASYDPSQQPPAPPVSRAEVGPNMSVAPREGQTQVEPAAPPGPTQAKADAEPRVSPDDAARAAGLGYVMRPTGRTKAGFTPKGKEETVESTGVPLTEEQKAQWVEGRNTEFGGIVQSHVHQAADQLRQSDALVNQAAQLQQRAAGQTRIRDKARALTQQDLAKYQAISDDVANKKVNPERFFQSKGTFSQIGIVIGQALGAYAATLRGGDNYAQKMISQMIDQDVAAQRDEIENGHASANNALKAYQIHFDGDLNQAQAALTGTLNQAAAADAMAQAKASQSKQTLIDGQTLAGQFQQESIKQAQAIESLGMGKHTEKLSAQYHAGGGGAPDERTIQSRLTTLGMLGKQGLVPDLSPEGRREERKLGQEDTKLDIEKQKAAGGGSRGLSDRTQRANVVAGNNALGQVDKALGILGQKPNPQTGEFDMPGRLSRAGAQAGQAWNSLTAGTESKQLEVLKSAITEELGKLQGGGVASEGQVHENKALLDSNDPAAFIQIRRNIAEMIKNNQQSHELMQPGVTASDRPSDEEAYEAGAADGR